MFDRFWFCLCFWRLVGVFGEMKYVKIGHSVTLNSGLSEMMDEDLIQWRSENRLIAEINVTAGRFSVYEDVHKGIFRDRLKLDDKTGSLTITNITTEHAGVYRLYTVETNTVIESFLLRVYDEISVKEGDSVTLNSDRTEIDYDRIQWEFENSLIAEINVTAGRFSVNDDALDGRFRDRLKLDDQTGSLIITNITTEHAGRYELVIDRMRKSFFLNAVNEEISVKKGDSVTLNSDRIEIMNGVLIEWRFGAELTLLAEISKRGDGFSVYKDVLDERFRDRLKLDNQTGSLIITNITTEHAGRYLHIRPKHLNLNQSLKAFSVSVYDSVHCCGSTEAVIRLVLSALVGVATVLLLVYDIRRTEQNQAQIHTSGACS